MRLIDADALSKSIQDGTGASTQKLFADICVATAPTIDVIPITYGKFDETKREAQTGEIVYGFECSACKTFTRSPFVHSWNYCPNCGMKVDRSIDSV